MKIKLLIILIIASLFFSRTDSSAQNIVASHNKYIVDSLVCTIDSTARLYMIQSGNTVSLDGKSSFWNFWYMNNPKPPNTLISYYFHTTFDSAFHDSTSSFLSHSQYGWAYISKPWFDSDSAMVLAERQGGANFRINNPHNVIAASLLEPLHPDYLMPHWRIWYISTDNPDSILVFNFDATDNRFTDVRKFDQIYPVDFVLNQNYPNPFNPKTAITFSLAHSARVNLSVFNILGRQICSLLSQRFSAGLFKSE